MSSFVAQRLSPHTGLTPEGFFVAVGAVISRCGMMVYKASELGFAGGDRLIRVWRAPSEVFSKTSMGSAEGKPITSPHPSKFVRAENWSSVSKGHLQNVRMGPVGDDGNQQLLADLVIGDSGLVEQVKLGLTDLSLGYDCSYVKLPDDSPLGDYAQINITVNHCAVVPKGRGGSTKIMDSVEDNMTIDDAMQRLDTLLDLLKGKPMPAKKAADRKPTRDGRPLTFDEVCDAIKERDRQSNFAYGEAINRVGKALRERRSPEDCRPSLMRRRATDHAENEDPHAWADAINEQGRRLRERR
jgi:hypothetical protein